MLRFTIRDVLWLTVVVGLGVGWFLSYRSQRHEYLRSTDSLVREIEAGSFVWLLQRGDIRSVLDSHSIHLIR